ncbi:NAD-dependent epimerase/dehydratase family protein [Leptolyngbya sp. AN03gr2]|uniref:NAD-dependent epimerase/dehydratase family protein n=1 Tax=unclassified Leptolyngbya TaxID=2650499 RepID=UPI003D316754
MKLLITGASGFLGQYVVAEALRRGHQVRAIVRPVTNIEKLSWHGHPNLELVRLDLRRKDGLVEALDGISAVIHLAAAKSGDFYAQFAGTVLATENLLEAMKAANMLRLIAISTFSVYDYWNLPIGSVLTEDSAVEKNPLERDEYAQTKLLQERLVREFEQENQAPVTILRPGMIYGRDALWNPCLGAELTDTLWLRIGARAQMPLNYVENCAEAILLAAEKETAIGQTINLVDDNLPTQREFAKKLFARQKDFPPIVPLNWTFMRGMTWILWLYNKKVLKGQAKFPGIFVPAKLHARFKPLIYQNDRAKELLQWIPRYSLDEAFDRSCSSIDLLSVPAPSPALSNAR